MSENIFEELNLMAHYKQIRDVANLRQFYHNTIEVSPPTTLTVCELIYYIAANRSQNQSALEQDLCDKAIMFKKVD
ncbi:hypothetical protein ACHWQZ_G013055 [Mnemiopsis leidyi]